MAHAALATRDISKGYGGVPVLHRVSLEVPPGTVLGLVGENGAGKSTLLNILCGVTRPDEGEILVEGQMVRPRSYHQANRLGIFRVFQEGALIANLTVYENLLLSHEGGFSRLGFALDTRAMKRAAARVLAEAGLSIHPETRAGDLDLAHRQAVEIARATTLCALLGIERPIILLDEPTTALDARDERGVLRLVQRLKGKATFIFVSHRFEEISEVCDSVCVLKDGRIVATMPVQEATSDTLRRLMVGREAVADDRPAAPQVPRRSGAVLSVRALSVPGVLRDVTFEVQPGEILGLGGLTGSGKSEAGQALGGLIPHHGTIEVGGRPVRRSVRGAMATGLVYMPGDRQNDGLVLGASIGANIVLASLHDTLAAPLGRIKIKRARGLVAQWMDRLRIVAPGPHVACDTLSGGQQQKVLFAKLLSRNPAAFVLENPTRGVDTGTKVEIYRLLRELAAGGAGIVLISDDLPELIGLAERIVILSHGEVVGTVAAPAEAKPTEHALLALMLAHRGDGPSVVEPGPPAVPAPMPLRH